MRQAYYAIYSMKRYPFTKLLLSLSVVALFGIGCNTTAPSKTPPETTISQTASSTVTTPTSSSAENAPVIDETWDSYSSKSGFTFQYPTKGRLTPEWSIDNFATNDAKILDGCYLDGSSERDGSRTKMKINNTEFCVTRTADPGAGQIYYADNYAFENGRSITVITFVKHFANGSNFEREACHGKTVVPVGTNDCALFEESDYINLLDSVIKTFSKE